MTERILLFVWKQGNPEQKQNSKTYAYLLLDKNLKIYFYTHYYAQK